MRTVVFDLDNTLYDEWLFLHEAFLKISEHLGKKYGREEVFRLLMEIYESHDRTYPMFDALLERLGAPKEEMGRVLELYYGSGENARPYEDAEEVLRELGKKYELVLLTEGRPELQRRKLRSLGLEGFFSEVIVIDERFGRIHRKPSPLPFLHLLAGREAKETAYVADNPFKDFLAPNRLGIFTVRLRRGIYARYPDEAVLYEMRPKVTVESLKELRDFL
ncbi:MAG: HAD family hydrolase [Acidilobaceae archaeon]